MKKEVGLLASARSLDTQLHSCGHRQGLGNWSLPGRDRRTPTTHSDLSLHTEDRPQEGWDQCPLGLSGRMKHRNIQVVGLGLKQELGGDNEGQSLGEQGGLCRVMMKRKWSRFCL